MTRKALLSLSVFILICLIQLVRPGKLSPVAAYEPTKTPIPLRNSAEVTKTPSSLTILPTPTATSPASTEAARQNGMAQAATITAVNWGKVPLNPINAGKAVQKMVWGAGYPLSSIFAADGQVFIQNTPFGSYIYRAHDLQLIRFLPDSLEYFLSPNGDLFFTRMPDGKVRVIHLPDAKDLYTLQPIAALSPRMREDIYAQLPKDRPAAEKRYFSQVTQMTALAVTSDTHLVAIGFGDASIGIWNLNTGKLVQRLKNDVVSEVLGLIFSPDGKKLLSTGEDSDVAVWQVADARLLWRLPGVGHIVGQPFSADGSLLALEITQGNSAWAAVRDTVYGDELGTPVVGVIASQAISPDDTRLVTTWYNTIKLWSVPGLRQLGKITTDLDWPQASFSTDGRYILLNNGQQAYLADSLALDSSYPAPTATPSPVMEAGQLLTANHLTRPLGIRFRDPDQAYVWGVLSKSATWVLRLSTGQVSTYDFGSPLMAEPDLSPAADRITACTEAGLAVITLADGKVSTLNRCRGSGVVRFSADGKTIFRANGTLIDALDSTSGELRYNLRGHSFLVESLELTVDGKHLVSASNFQRTLGREMILWQVDEPRQIHNWMVSVMPEGKLLSTSLDQNSQVLYTAMGGLRAWRLTDYQQHHLDTTNYSSLALSSDNRLLAYGDALGNVHILSLVNWEELAVLSGHRQPVVRLLFTPDRASLLSASADGTIRLWSLP